MLVKLHVIGNIAWSLFRSIPVDFLMHEQYLITSHVVVWLTPANCIIQSIQMKGIIFRYKSQLMIALACLCFVRGESQQVGVVVTTSETALQVTVRQEMNFGAFAQGSFGGNLSISPEGMRTASGSVVPLNFGATYLPLILEIEGPRGAILSILAQETTLLTGSNGGTIKLKITSSNPALPFIIADDAPAKTILKIGAELIIGNVTDSPPGNYSGTVNISFVRE